MDKVILPIPATSQHKVHINAWHLPNEEKKKKKHTKLARFDIFKDRFNHLLIIEHDLCRQIANLKLVSNLLRILIIHYFGMQSFK